MPLPLSWPSLFCSHWQGERQQIFIHLVGGYIPGADLISPPSPFPIRRIQLIKSNVLWLFSD
jgi:hypothetical protein